MNNPRVTISLTKLISYCFSVIGVSVSLVVFVFLHFESKENSKRSLEPVRFRLERIELQQERILEKVLKIEKKLEIP